MEWNLGSSGTHSFMASSFFSPFSFLLINPQASNISERIPHRGGSTLSLSSSRSAEFVTDERNTVHIDSKNRNGSKNGGSMGFRQMGHSSFSLSKSKNESSDVVHKNFEGNTSAVVEKKKKGRKVKVSTRDVDFRVKLDMCSKAGDVMAAISLYESALQHGIKLEQYHYNVLLYLCSSASIGVIHPAKSGSSGSNTSVSYDSESDDSSYGELDSRNDGSNTIDVSDDVRVYARTRGFEIYEQMSLWEIPMSEASLTSVARMAMSIGNGDMAFEIVKQMKAMGITPRLRSYGPAIFAFCNGGDVEKAFEVEKHMLESGISPEEPELEALLRVSVSAGRGEKVYYLLHKLRTNVRQVSPSTADLIEAWFKSSTASRVGKRKFDEEKIKQATENSGGGWHGLGWLGKGKWAVIRTHVDGHGVCMGCGEKLVTIDLDPIETENFATSIASIASDRERNSSFQKFQRWLDYYGPFEVVVDAANVGLFSQRQFSLMKVNAVVNAIRHKLPSKKWPLIIVHNRRLLGRKMAQPLNEKLIEKWKNADAIYATPTGSNDDWYWLYAAIKCKSLIVTNDEMRDHVFQILGNDFIPKWKERHQVHFGFRDGTFEFQMPPPCSVVIQESEKGHWHIPIIEEHDCMSKRTWLCVMRASSHVATQDSSILHAETHSDTSTRRNASEEQGCDARRQQCHSYTIHPSKIIGGFGRQTTSSNSTNFHTVFRDVEAAEKISGCVIDFQI